MLEFGGIETKGGALLLTSGSLNCSLNDHEIIKELSQDLQPSTQTFMYWVRSASEYHDAYLGVVKEPALPSEVTYLT